MQDAIAANQNDVRNDLFMSRVVLSQSSGQEIIIPPRQDDVEIALRLEVQPVEAAELVKEASPDDEDVFVRCAHRSLSILLLLLLVLLLFFMSGLD